MSTSDRITSTTIDSVRAFIVDHFPAAGQRGISDDDSLVDTGVVDSLGVLEIVDFIETSFQVTMTDDEMLSTNFESIAAITAFIEAKIE